MLDAIEPFATVAGVVALIVGGAWAGFQYTRARRSANAQWLTSLYRDFYIDSRIARARTRLEDEYDDLFRPVVQDWVSGRRSARQARRWDREVEQDLDLLLNFLEMLSRLERSGEFPEGDLLSLFEYWLSEVVGSQDRPELRLYVQAFGYEGLCELIGRATARRAGSSPTLRRRQSGGSLVTPLEDPLRVAVYGSLVPGSLTWASFERFAAEREQLDIGSRMIVEGSCTIVGTLVDLGEFPGLQAGDGHIRATLLRLLDEEMLALFDAYEELATDRPVGYYRDFVPVTRVAGSEDSHRGAWAYFWRGPVDADRIVASGDWEAHLRSRAVAPPNVEGL